MPHTQEISIEQTGSHIEVSTPFVNITGSLPLACDMTGHGAFVSFPRLSVRCYLSPSDIVRHLSIGQQTMVSEQTRPYLVQHNASQWKVQLGKTSVQLSLNEVQDLCSCLDILSKRYTDALRQGTTYLEAWNYPMEFLPGRAAGARILTLNAKAWYLLQCFTQSYQMDLGNSPWHCFDNHSDSAIGIYGPDHKIHATLWALPPEIDNQESYIPILYEFPDQELLALANGSSRPWREQVGGTAVWTAEFTHQWVSMVLLPHVLAYYQVDRTSQIKPSPGIRYNLARWLASDLLVPYQTFFSPSTIALPDGEALPKIETAACPLSLAKYAQTIHLWLTHYPATRLPAALFHAYYTAIAEIASQADPIICTTVALIGSADVEQSSLISRGNGVLTESFEAFLASLKAHARRVAATEYEDVRLAALITQTFVHILENGSLLPNDGLFQQVKTALLPLWEQASFDHHFCVVTTSERK